jgi:hypothetical protein
MKTILRSSTPIFKDRRKVYTTAMYVRWQSRKRRRAAFGKRKERGDVHWRAILVENERINGKPTQRHIAYLGGITESAIATPPQCRWFWEGVMKKLNELSLPRAYQRRIIAAVAKKVGAPPTAAQCRRHDRELLRKYGIKPKPSAFYKD